jgi:hypothetical protein
MKRLPFVLAVLVLSACGADDFECDVAALDGAYLITYSERGGGTCGQLSDQVALFASGEAVSDPGNSEETCTDDYIPPSTDACVDRGSTTCTDVDGYSFHIEGQMTQKTDSGSRYEGLATFSVFDPDGRVECISTYNMKAVRQ